MRTKKIRFVNIQEAIDIHKDQIVKFEGLYGIRDLNLLISAINTPCATFGKQYLHADIFEMAAAYMYHIIKNHPFVDGNKRAGFVTALVFLQYNNITIDLTFASAYNLTIKIASSKISKEEAAQFLRSRCVN